MEDSGLKSKFKSSVTSLINTPRHCLIQMRLVFVVVLACFTLMRSVMANIDVSFDHDNVVAYISKTVELNCTATSILRPLVYWDRIKEPNVCESLKAPECSHVIDPNSGTQWKWINCNSTSSGTCNPAKHTITTGNGGSREIRKTTLKIRSLSIEDGEWKYACKAWRRNSADYGEAIATLTVCRPGQCTTKPPVHTSSSSNSSSITSSPPGGGSGGVGAAGADNGVVVAIASAVIVAIINVV